MKNIAAFLLALLLVAPAWSQKMRGATPPDPYLLDDTIFAGNAATSPLTIRSATIDPAKRTLILIAFGQSQASNVLPSLFTPVNSTVVDNFNIYDGADYNVGAAMVGTTNGINSSGTALGPGNVVARLADLFVTNGEFDRVIVVPIAIGGVAISDWSTGHLSAPGIGGRFGVAMRRLAARGITPATTGATFAALWMQGETDGVNGTSQAAYQASWATIYAAMLASGYSASSRVFVNVETWINGTTYPIIQAAQVAIPGGSVFAGANLDTLNATFRQSDNTHFNDTGGASAATLMYNAMHASGSPF